MTENQDCVFLDRIEQLAELADIDETGLTPDALDYADFHLEVDEWLEQ